MENNLKSLRIYQISRELSKLSWEAFIKFDWKIQKNIGDQFIRSVDSIGANIAESYGRFHYLDKIKFLYNARGSYYESIHWIELLGERSLLENEKLKSFEILMEELIVKLNGYINFLYKSKTT